MRQLSTIEGELTLATPGKYGNARVVAQRSAAASESGGSTVTLPHGASSLRGHLPRMRPMRLHSAQ